MKNIQQNRAYPHHKLPTFDGETGLNVTDFLEQFEEISKVNNWTTDKRLHELKISLHGAAKSWLRNQPEDLRTDYRHLKKKMMEYYNSEDMVRSIKKQLRNTRQEFNESVESFVNKLSRLFYRVGLNESYKLEYFIEGLKPSLQEYVTICRPKSFSEAVQLAKTRESNPNTLEKQFSSMTRRLDALQQLTTLQGNPQQMEKPLSIVTCAHFQQKLQEAQHHPSYETSPQD